MKNLYFTLLTLAVLAGSAFGAASVSKPALIHLTGDGGAYPAMREALDSGKGSYLIHLDTLEVDTSYVVFNTIKDANCGYTDTLAMLLMSCRDSTGTDTIAIQAIRQGNSRSDGKGVWVTLDTLEIKDLTTAEKTGYKVGRGAWINLGYPSYRLLTRNKLATSAARKATCKDAVLVDHEKAGCK